MANIVLSLTNQIDGFLYVSDKRSCVVFSNIFNARSLSIVSTVIKLTILNLCGGPDTAFGLVFIVTSLVILSALFLIETCESIV